MKEEQKPTLVHSSTRASGTTNQEEDPHPTFPRGRRETPTQPPQGGGENGGELHIPRMRCTNRCPAFFVSKTCQQTEKIVSLQSKLKHTSMARPIKETPILFGEDARRFEARMKEHRRVSPEERARIKANFEAIIATANF